MVAPGYLAGGSVSCQAGPDIGEQCILAQELRPFICANPAANAHSLHRYEQGRTFDFGLEYVEKIYASLPDDDIFAARGISREGAVVVVRPDQYVSGVFPLDAHSEIADFFAGVFEPVNRAVSG